MKSKIYVLLLAIAGTLPLIWMPESAKVLAQGKQRPAPVILGPPAGVQPLETDLFTSKNFYKDKALWLDKRYYRCNPPIRLTEMWNEQRIGKNPPASASWGNCDADLDRENILSKYPYKTAKDYLAPLT